MSKPFTGRHMALVMVAFFGVVIAVNVTMARLAGSTFGGVVVENSYVASQNFNAWLDKAEAQKALGWSAMAVRRQDGRVEVQLAGVPAGDVRLSGAARHPLGRLPDHGLAFATAGAGRFVSSDALPQGRWRVRLEVQAAGQTWRGEQDVL
ncbi:MAG: FixH family protein [Novosphingobium sp.]